MSDLSGNEFLFTQVVEAGVKFMSNDMLLCEKHYTIKKLEQYCTTATTDSAAPSPWPKRAYVGALEGTLQNE